MMKTPIAVLGIDLGKNSCSLAGIDATGAVVMRKRNPAPGPERLVNARTTLINQLRAVLLERGIILPKGRVNLMRRLENLMTGDPAVSARTRTLLADLRDEWAGLDRRVKEYDDELAALTREDVQARRLATIPGIGVINATALLAAIGDGSAFAKGRDLAAWLGTTTALDRWQDEAARDQQARERLPAQAADPRRPSRHAPPGRQAEPAGSLVAEHADARSSQCHGGGEAGANCLGSAATRRRLRSAGARRRLIVRNSGRTNDARSRCLREVK